ncbi:FtsX-like permease family protein [Paraclostridium bifermentans]|nr:FtsX-like permease family protein [Paraclostridium bifermentans]
MGVLRAMGMKKGKVALGLIFETLSMILISLSIGLTIGSICAQPVSNMLLQGQIDAQKQAESMSMTIGFGGSKYNSTSVRKTRCIFKWRSYFKHYANSIITRVVSAGIGILYINRYEPRKILTERN